MEASRLHVIWDQAVEDELARLGLLSLLKVLREAAESESPFLELLELDGLKVWDLKGKVEDRLEGVCRQLSLDTPGDVQMQLLSITDYHDGEQFPWMDPAATVFGESRRAAVVVNVQVGVPRALNTLLAEEDAVTPLHLAAYWGDRASAEELIGSQADVNAATTPAASTPLHMLAGREERMSERHIEVVRMLIDAKADVAKVDTYNCTPLDWTDDGDVRSALGGHPLLLHRAVQQKDVEALREALGKVEAGELPSDILAYSNRMGASALHLAAMRADAAYAELLLAARASVDCLTRETWQTPLHLAAHAGNFLVARHLVQGRADVNLQEPDLDHDWSFCSRSFQQEPEKHFTALHVASRGGNVVMMRELLEARAAVDARDSYGCTPLHLCVEASRDAELGLAAGVCVVDGQRKRELGAGAIIDMLVPGCSGCADPGCEQETREVVVLFENGPAAGLKVELGGLQALHDEAIDLLLAASADVNLGHQRVGVDHSVLHGAALSGDLALARKAIAAGANVNLQRAGSGLSPLHMAIRGRRRELIALLLASGADVDLKAGGKTAGDLAMVNGLVLEPAGCEQQVVSCKQQEAKQWVPSEFEKAALYLE